ncbi:MAG: hypothetical protein M3Y93_10530 [Pseudomonadota bacterium]|nr:hypothetical protein [Pseudomonadota bacterium]
MLQLIAATLSLLLLAGMFGGDPDIDETGSNGSDQQRATDNSNVDDTL